MDIFLTHTEIITYRLEMQSIIKIADKIHSDTTLKNGFFRIQTVLQKQHQFR